MKKYLFSPYAAMGIAVAMYIVKVGTKLGVGYTLNSPMIIGDGYHNVSDIFEALGVILMVFLAGRPKSDNYPLGRKNAESIVELAIGVSLLILGLKLLSESALGLLAWIPSLTETIEGWGLFHRESLVVGTVWSGYFWAAVLVTGGNAILSLTVSVYQVSVGRRTNHVAVVADGKETRSDSYVEMVAFAGVMCEYIFHQPRLEYVFTLAVAVKLLLTSYELGMKGLRTLMQRSLGEEINEAIKSEAMRMCGVEKVPELKTFQVGPKAIVIMKIHTRCQMHATACMKKALVTKLNRLLKSHDFEEVEFYVRFDRPSPKPHRIAFAISVADGRETIAGSLEGADQLRICELRSGGVKRVTCEDMPDTLAAIAARLGKKMVGEVFVFGQGSDLEREVCENDGIKYSLAELDNPRVYKCDAEDPCD